MARDHARIKVSIWGDTDWRMLSSDSQWLYLYLLSSPTLNYAGVADWRPRRIAAMTGDGDSDYIEQAAYGLEQCGFIVVDRDTEEVAIRTFVKHDGLIGKPNVAIAFCKAWQSTASLEIRAVIAQEIVDLHDEEPHLKGWDNESSLPWLEQVLGHELMTWGSAQKELPPNPFAKGSAKGLREVR